MFAFKLNFRAVDESIPKSLLDSIQNVLSVFGLIFVTAVVNPYFLVPVFFLSFIFIFIQKVYLRTSKDVKRLEGIGNFFFHII